MPAALFHIRELTKVYGMGEVEVHALREVTLTLPLSPLAAGTFIRI